MVTLDPANQFVNSLISAGRMGLDALSHPRVASKVFLATLPLHIRRNAGYVSHASLPRFALFLLAFASTPLLFYSFSFSFSFSSLLFFSRHGIESLFTSDSPYKLRACTRNGSTDAPYLVRWLLYEPGTNVFATRVFLVIGFLFSRARGELKWVKKNAGIIEQCFFSLSIIFSYGNAFCSKPPAKFSAALSRLDASGWKSMYPGWLLFLRDRLL